MLRRVLVSSLAAVAVALPGLATGASAQQSAPTNWSVWAGQSSGDGSLSSNDFQPRPLEIHVGDTVTWQAGGLHNIAFGRGRVPFLDPGTGDFLPAAAVPSGGSSFDGKTVVTSGLMSPPAPDSSEPSISSFKLTFTAPGTYQYVCDLHPNMDGTVVVKPAGQPLAMTPEQAQAAAIDHYYRLDFTGRSVPLVIKASDVTATEGSGLQATAGTGDGHVSVMRFLPGALVVHAGDSLTWINADPIEPHTVTFLPGGVLPGPDSGPPPADFNPFKASGGAVYSGAELVNSGALWNDPRESELSAGNSFTVQFTSPGTYQYLCVLHAELGMVGQVTVLP